MCFFSAVYFLFLFFLYLIIDPLSHSSANAFESKTMTDFVISILNEFECASPMLCVYFVCLFTGTMLFKFVASIAFLCRSFFAFFFFLSTSTILLFHVLVIFFLMWCDVLECFPFETAIKLFNVFTSLHSIKLITQPKIVYLFLLEFLRTI